MAMNADREPGAGPRLTDRHVRNRGVAIGKVGWES